MQHMQSTGEWGTDFTTAFGTPCDQNTDRTGLPNCFPKGGCNSHRVASRSMDHFSSRICPGVENTDGALHAPQQCSPGVAACYLPCRLTCALMMTSSHSEDTETKLHHGAARNHILHPRCERDGHGVERRGVRWRASGGDPAFHALTKRKLELMDKYHGQ